MSDCCNGCRLSQRNGFDSGVTGMDSGVVSADGGIRRLAPSGTQRINIEFQSNGDGIMECVGFGRFSCLGQIGRGYPRDLTVTPSDKERRHISREFNNVPMPFSIRIWGQCGIYIHEWGYCTVAGSPSGPDAAHGCIHLCSPDAESVFNWVQRRTRILINYPWQVTVPPCIPI
jgi:hypothetical protein